jgi:hypothetical protein
VIPIRVLPKLSKLKQKRIREKEKFYIDKKQANKI